MLSMLLVIRWLTLFMTSRKAVPQDVDQAKLHLKKKKLIIVGMFVKSFQKWTVRST